MPMYEYTCEDCDITVAEFRTYEERHLGGQCDLCHRPMRLAFITAPGQLNTALPDGAKRKGFTDLKEAAKLNAEAMDSRPADRKALLKEVDKLNKI